MHVPVSREEIAEFLEISSVEVECLWATKRLRRTVFHDSRLSSAFAQSSIFDVIEYGLFAGDFCVKLSAEHAAMWVTYLCEVCEESTWAASNLQDRAFILLTAAGDDGLCEQGNLEAARTAVIIISVLTSLLNICATNDEASIYSDAI